jgi:phosphate transport system protein
MSQDGSANMDPVTAAHPRPALDRELHRVQDELLRMGSLLDTAIVRALEALAGRDLELARHVVADDEVINALRYAIEEDCLTVIATQQPAAGDLRTIVASLSIVADLERMADHAAGIATTVLRMGDAPLLKPLIDIPRMADTCRSMLHQALTAFVERDAELARRVAAQDDAVDELYHQVFRELLTYMIEDPRTITRALFLMFTAHNLERIADRVTNISERVVFMLGGEVLNLNASGDGPTTDWTSGPF